MQRTRKAKNFLPRPIYRGGPTALRAFIAKNLKYPPLAKENRVEGTVVLRIDIDYKGKVIGSNIKSSLGHGCNEEAQRVVSLLKFDVDRKYRRGKILFHKNINIHFKLPKTEPVKTQISYQITSKKKAKKPSNSYGYTVTITS